MAESVDYRISEERKEEWVTVSADSKIALFRAFLADHDFFTAWNEGYDIDNAYFNDNNVTLKDFFENCEEITWLYAGPGILGLGVSDDFTRVNPPLAQRASAWLQKYQSTYAQLDALWVKNVRSTNTKS